MASEDAITKQAQQLARRTALSEREAEVAIQKALARPDEYKKDIAERLGINASTLSDHLSSIEAKLDDENVGAAYWQFYAPLGDLLDVRYRDLFSVRIADGHLTVFENAFRSDAPSGSRFVVVCDSAVHSVTPTRGVKRRRHVTDWYQFETPEQVAEGVLSSVEFGQSGAGSVSEAKFKEAFEEEFGFDPTEVAGAFEFGSFSAQEVPEAHRTLFLSTDADSDVAATLADRYDAFAEFFEGRDVADLLFKNPRVEDGATLVVEDIALDSKGKAVLTLEDEVFLIDGDGTCDCGHVNDFTSRMGEPSGSSYDRRRQESCSHEVASLNATDIQRTLTKGGPKPPEDAEHSPCCPVCGYTGVTERRMHNQGQWVMSEYSCALCGEKHGSD